MKLRKSAIATARSWGAHDAWRDEAGLERALKDAGMDGFEPDSPAYRTVVAAYWDGFEEARRSELPHQVWWVAEAFRTGVVAGAMEGKAQAQGRPWSATRSQREFDRIASTLKVEQEPWGENSIRERVNQAAVSGWSAAYEVRPLSGRAEKRAA